MATPHFVWLMLLCFVIDEIPLPYILNHGMDQESQAAVIGIEHTIHGRRSAGICGNPMSLSAAVNHDRPSQTPFVSQVCFPRSVTPI
ncbi:uncharacterized protein LY79DRAFT_546741 [Colletotrichum navitas]|uniref:Secreted protein n=1 Tax=Colletotrichum navitas TaxID=681940 RepID=A0AAD8Q5M9_9PEZI|nr:uncharacterized protein LY79DRAFT_546741 [Colletotrichum navitas]KAK1595557.1 hypothetical protein LY79DRAFT_546741 [Colletotrichum navitas]